MKTSQERLRQLNQLSCVTNLSDGAAATCGGGACESGDPVGIDGTQPQLIMYRDGNTTSGPSGPAFPFYNISIGGGIPNLAPFSMSPPPGSTPATVSWNDQVTFVTVNQGDWEYYADSNYGGKKQKLKAGSCYALKYNEQLSSIRRVK
jgi:hypothetical protein